MVKQLGLHPDRLGILEDLGYVPQVDVLGDVMGKEMGEDVSLGSAQPTLCLAAEHALEHSFTSMTNNMKVKDAQGFVINSTPKALDDLARHAELLADSTRRETIPDSVQNRQAFQARQRFTGASLRKFAQSFQFARYWRFSGMWRYSTFRLSLGHFCPH